MRATVVVALLVLGAGCVGQSRWPGRAISGIAIISGAAGVISAQTCSPNCSFHDDLNNDFGVVALVLGLVALAYNEARHIDPEPEPVVAPNVVVRPDQPSAPPEIHEARPAAAASPTPPTDDPMLRQLTLQASTAAREGHCPIVLVVAKQVAARDDAYFHGGFRADPAIVACLGP